MKKTKVFVYGTLRKGAARSADIDFGAEYLGAASVKGSIYDLGWYPGFLPSEDEESTAVVHGDIFEVTPEQLDRLDDYEGEGLLYLRRPVVTTAGDCEDLNIYVYGFPADCVSKNRIHSGDWIQHLKEEN